MARGRKKESCRDLRNERIRAIEAAKFLNMNERLFYRLVEKGYIRKLDDGVYSLGDIVQDFLKLVTQQSREYHYLLDNFLAG